jgi:hypothetical protein
MCSGFPKRSCANKQLKRDAEIIALQEIYKPKSLTGERVMRQMIKGLVAAFAVMTAGAAPAMACGYGPCATYAPAYSYVYGSGCGTCGNTWANVWAYDRLAEPTTQYYYVNQGPTYSGPGAFAPYPTYQETAIPAYTGYGYGYHHRHHYRPHHYAYRQPWGHEGYYNGHPLVRRYY